MTPEIDEGKVQPVRRLAFDDAASAAIGCLVEDNLKQLKLPWDNLAYSKNCT